MPTNTQQSSSIDKQLSPVVGVRFDDESRQRVERICNQIYLTPGTWVKQQVLTILETEEKRLGLEPIK